ncbi:MAG: DUF1573 domain-containing protein [Planctomycetaceae bacterium]|jgi:hypothetical protein|nr:DUF1573 domain-containing protein [Planctomycetaceae bacterium]
MKSYCLLFIFVTIIIFFNFVGECFSSWGESLFETRYHDFGRVAIGSLAEYRFSMTNRFQQDIRVISLNTSCSCTRSSLSSYVIGSGSTEYLTATLNTSGQHIYAGKAIITIHFEVLVEGRVLRDSAQISVSGFIRPDVVLSPSGVIEFGAVNRGESVVRQIRLEYVGRSGWELTKVERTNPHVHVKAEPIPFPDGSFWRNGEIHYKITATLKPDAPVGYVKDVIRFSTNERDEFIRETGEKSGNVNFRGEEIIKRAEQIIVPISGVVTEPIQVKPLSLVIGLSRDDDAENKVEEDNASVSKNIVIRSAKQFRILGVGCLDKRFRFTFSERASNIQIIAVFFRTKNTNAVDSNQIDKNKIQIRTDLPDQKIISVETVQVN